MIDARILIRKIGENEIKRKRRKKKIEVAKTDRMSGIWNILPTPFIKQTK